MHLFFFSSSKAAFFFLTLFGPCPCTHTTQTMAEAERSLFFPLFYTLFPVGPPPLVTRKTDTCILRFFPFSSLYTYREIV